MAAQGQTITDRLNAARHSLAGQGLAKAVCKATTEELLAPKRKHLVYLVECTFEPNVSIPQLASLLQERVQNTSWVVVFKGLFTMHHLMCYGNERFMQYMASCTNSLQPNNFIERSGGYGAQQYIHRYAKYINVKAVSYRTVAFDFCRLKRGKEPNIVRGMSEDKLLKLVPVIESNMDALVDFQYSSHERNSGIALSVFIALFRDLVRLFACYNDAIINLLEKYFAMDKKHCREALAFYKGFIARMPNICQFMETAEQVGVEKSDIPDLKQAPSSLLSALEQHLAYLEGKKGATATSDTSVVEALKQQALAEEKAELERIKNQHDKTNPFLGSPASNGSAAAASGATSASPTAAAAAAGGPDGSPVPVAKSTKESILDLFSVPTVPVAQQQPAMSTAYMMQTANNPFANMMAATTYQPPNFQSYPAAAAPGTATTSNMFANTTTTAPAVSDMFGGGVLMPAMNTDLFGGVGGAAVAPVPVLQQQPPFQQQQQPPFQQQQPPFPQQQQPPFPQQQQQPLPPQQKAFPPPAAQQQNLISTDLDQSLQSLVQNLGITGSSGYGKVQVGGALTAAAPSAAAGAGLAGTGAPNWTGAGIVAPHSMPTQMNANNGSQFPANSAVTAAFDPFGPL